jgi:DNA-binding XRE family transcriptional regulator
MYNLIVTIEGGKEMWKFKDKEIAKIYNKTKMAKVIGITPDTLRRVINGKQNCSKLVAYCITKFLSEDAEIADYFDYIEREK